MASKITRECQVTLPRFVLDQLGIGPGSEVEFRHAADGGIVLEKAEAAPPLDPDRFAKLRGIAGPGPSTDEIMAMTRGD
jgi:AbrB family looped-hinge helix DNA binding protein